MKPMEFSKKLLIFSWTVTLILTVLTVWMALTGRPGVDTMSVITSLSWAESTTQTGFYHWKAKNENRAKYAQRFLHDIAREWGPETAIRMAEIVLKD